MRYLGGKTRLAKEISSLVRRLGRDKINYVEPFMGGGSVLAEIAPAYDRSFASDVHSDLIMMWKAAQDGWIPPTVVTEEEYHIAKTADPSPLRGFIGFACSFGAKWFGGYARDRAGTNYAAQGSRAVVRKAKAFRDTEIRLMSYLDVNVGVNDVVYCDPPYKGTQAYGGTSGFNHDTFWNTAKSWSDRGAVVLVSEYSAPEGWTEVYQRQHVQQLIGLDNKRPKTTEKIFTIAAK